VTYTTAADEEFDDTPDEAPRRSALFHIVVAVILAGFGSGSALLWRSYGNGMLPSSSSVASSAAPAADKPVAQSDMRALQQQIAGSVQSTERLLAAQQAEIKRLSDQVVVLSAKLDLLQRPLTSAQAALPAPAAKPVAPAPKKKPAPVQTTGVVSTGVVSTGGAPLPPPVPLTRQQ
jgi:hypothetical protein